MTNAKSINVAKLTRSVEWTVERIGTLDTIGIRNLRANSERLNDPEIMKRCDTVLTERRRASRLAAQASNAGTLKKPAAKKVASAGKAS